MDIVFWSIVAGLSVSVAASWILVKALELRVRKLARRDAAFYRDASSEEVEQYVAKMTAAGCGGLERETRYYCKEFLKELSRLQQAAKQGEQHGA